MRSCRYLQFAVASVSSWKVEWLVSGIMQAAWVLHVWGLFLLVLVSEVPCWESVLLIRIHSRNPKNLTSG